VCALAAAAAAAALTAAVAVGVLERDICGEGEGPWPSMCV